MRSIIRDSLLASIAVSCMVMFFTNSRVLRAEQNQLIDDSPTKRTQQLRVPSSRRDNRPRRQAIDQLTNKSLSTSTNLSTEKPKHDFEALPKRLISVFGLESSGTTLVAETLAEAVGAEPQRFIGDLVLNTKRPNKKTEIQHLSLPFGFFYNDTKDRTVQDLDFLPPYQCMKWPHYPLIVRSYFDSLRAHPKCLSEAGLSERVPLPLRFMVNITSHVRWYQERGVQVTAVIVVRDDYTHIHGKAVHGIAGTNQTNATLADVWKEDLHAKQFIAQAIQHLSQHPNDKGDPPELVMVSYETLMSLQKPYLFDIYKKLCIDSSFVPELQNGNKKYIMPLNGMDNETWWGEEPGVLGDEDPISDDDNDMQKQSQRHVENKELAPVA